jgi:hypothetical protein
MRDAMLCDNSKRLVLAASATLAGGIFHTSAGGMVAPTAVNSADFARLMLGRLGSSRAGWRGIAYPCAAASQLVDMAKVTSPSEWLVSIETTAFFA